jgi:small subunit ribosomal protein S8
MTDPIADMLTRMRNALSAGRSQVSFPYSRLKEAIAGILKEQGYIADYKVDDKSAFKTIEVQLKEAAITEVSRISKPGRRIYTASKDIPNVLSGRGIVIVSTSNGVMTGREAKKRGLGGELICRVW